MKSPILERLLEDYEINTDDERFTAYREIFQEFTLAGLYRGNFFQRAAFYGGTCLRLFYGLPRFSEDLDFSLLAKDPEFSLEPYLDKVIQEFITIGIEVTIDRKDKKFPSQIESAFLKAETKIYDIKFVANKSIKIKLEVGILPPLDFFTEERLLLKPLPVYIKCFCLPDLFAGKLHALLFRSWKNRVKGRDWYDLAWYVQRGVSPNLRHFLRRAQENGDISTNQSILSLKDLKEMLYQKVDKLDIEQARIDVLRFIEDKDILNIWSKKYFQDIIAKIV